MRKIVEYRIQYGKENQGSRPEKAEAPAVQRALYSIFGELTTCFLVVALVFTFIGRTVIVDGDSMNPTLQNNDRLITLETVYTPERGDIVIISRVMTDEKPLVKRVIALAGDTVDVDFDTHSILINGEPLADFGSFDPISRQGDVSFPLTVPEDSLFVLGDNRNNSKDSRYTEVGCVATERVLGKAVLRLFPLDSITRLY